MTRVLYITYDGAMDPLGHSQILPYVEGLAALGVKTTLLSFEKPRMLADNKARKLLKARLEKNGIHWSILKYHKRPSLPATLYDIMRGFFRALSLVAREKIDFVHARSYIPAFIALLLKKTRGREFIFDMRGLWADERIDGGIWPKNSWLYRVAKELEKILLLNSKIIVVLTHRVKNIIENFSYMKEKNKKICIIPVCVDLTRFNIHNKDKGILNYLKAGERFILFYLGSIGTWYMLDEMIDFFKVFKDNIKNSFLLFVINNGEELVEDALRRKGISSIDFSVTRSSYSDVPKWTSVADASLIFITPAFSKKASCATKFGESLACGIPVIINSGVGDMDKIVKSSKTGIVIDEFNSDSYQKGVQELLDLMRDRKDLSSRCRNTAGELLSLRDGIDSFHRVYKSMMEINR